MVRAGTPAAVSSPTALAVVASPITCRPSRTAASAAVRAMRVLPNPARGQHSPQRPAGAAERANGGRLIGAQLGLGGERFDHRGLAQRRNGTGGEPLDQ